MSWQTWLFWRSTISIACSICSTRLKICELEPTSRDFFAFSSPSGHQYRYRRLPQGFANSPAIMSRVTAEILTGIPTSSREAQLLEPEGKEQGAKSKEQGAVSRGASGASGVSLPPASAAPPDTAPTNNSTLPPLTHPRIKPMSKTPPLENSGHSLMWMTFWGTLLLSKITSTCFTSCFTTSERLIAD